jgi:Amt family ammonium transporter
MYQIAPHGQEEIPLGSDVQFDNDSLQTRGVLHLLRTSEAERAALLAASRDAIITVDAAGRVKEFNRAAVRTLRCAGARELEAMLTRSLAAATHGPHGRSPLATMLLAASSLTGGCEFIFLRTDGSSFPAEATVTRCTGPAPCFVCVVHDLTDQRRLRAAQEFAAQEGAVGPSARRKVHDLCNMLTVITGYTELLLSCMGETHTSTDPLLAIKEASERATVISRQLLTSSFEDSGL